MKRNQQFPNKNNKKKVDSGHRSTASEQDEIDIVVSSGSTNNIRLETEPSKKKNMHRFVIGLLALALFLGGMFFFNSSSTIRIDQIQADGTASGISSGSYISGTTDDMTLQSRDYTIEMGQDAESNRVLIWDFAAEDGDVVTIMADGVLIAENIQIMHKPFVFYVPAPSVVEIIGVKDGGGGITYAVKIPGAVGNKVYFNAADVGSSNAYTFTGSQ